MARKEKGSRRKINREKIEQKAKSSNETSIFDYYQVPEGFEKFKVEKEGKMRLDIIPYELSQDGNPYADKGDIWYERTYYVHKIARENGTDTVVCPAKTADKDCPICDYVKQQSRSADGDEAEIKALLPKKRQLFNVIDRADPDTRYIWDMSYHLFGKALDVRVKTADEDEDYSNFPDVEEGSTLSIYFEEKHFGKATFYEAKTIDFKARKESYEDSDIDDSADLDSILILKTYDQLEKILHGEEAGPAEEVKSDKKKKKKKKGKKLDQPSFTKPEDGEDDTNGKSTSKDKGEDTSKPGKKSKKKKGKDEDEMLVASQSVQESAILGLRHLAPKTSHLTLNK